MIESTLKQRQHIRLHIGRWRPENATLFMVKQFSNWNQIWCHQIWWRWWYVGGGGRGNGVIISQMPVKLTEASINFINSTNETVDRYLWIDLFLLLLLFLFILFDLTFFCVCVSFLVFLCGFACRLRLRLGRFFRRNLFLSTSKENNGQTSTRPWCISSLFQLWFISTCGVPFRPLILPPSLHPPPHPPLSVFLHSPINQL